MEELKTSFDEELETPKKDKVTEHKPRPYLVWTVQGQEYKLKLTTAIIARLEDQFEQPLMDAVLDDGVPAQSKLIAILQGAMQKFQHGIKSDRVAELIDEYIEDGHNYMDMLADVLYPLMYDAGFFTKTMLEMMKREIANIDTAL